MKDSIKKMWCIASSLMLFALVFVASCKQGNDAKKDQQKPSGQQDQVKPIEQSTTVMLKSLTVNNANVEVKDEINLNKTEFDKIKIAYEVSPEDAEVVCTPELEEKFVGGGVWNIGSEAGKKTLKIQVKKGAEQHIYTLSIERVSANALKIKKITCGDEEINDNIFSIINFKDAKISSATLKVEPSDASATVEFKGFEESIDATSCKWLLANGDNSIGIILKKGDEVREYTANLKSTMQMIGVSQTLNGERIFNIPNEFEDKALTGKNPTFEAKCNSLLLQLITISQVKEVIVLVDGEKQEFPVPTVQGSGFKTSEKLYILNESEKQFEMFIVPGDSIATTTAGKHLKFKVKGAKNKIKLEPELSINNNAELPAELLDNLEKDEANAPLYKLFKGPAKLAISVSSYEKANLIKEVKINGTTVPFPARSNIIEHTVQVEENKTANVKIEFIPKNEEIVTPLTWNFRMELGGEKPAIIGINLASVNEVGSLTGSLPESLTKHIKDGSNPLYKYNGTTATVLFNVEEEALVNDALFKIDGDAGVAVNKVTEGRYTSFFHTYNITDLNEHNIEVIFHSAKTNDYADLTVKFRLQRTGNKIKIPHEPYIFMINGIPSIRMPKDVKEHLFDGTAPLYTIDGFDVTPIIGCFDESVFKMLKHVRMTFGDGTPQEIAFVETQSQFGTAWKAENTFSMQEAGKPYLLKVELIPNDAELYEPLVYTVNMKASGKAVDMPITFGVDWNPKKDGSNIKVNAESAKILVQDDIGIMESVTIEVKDVDSAPVPCEVKEYKNKNDKSFWLAMRDINLLEGNETPERTVIITVTPKNATKYNKATCTYRITGKKLAKDNAKFAFEGQYPKISINANFKAGTESKYYNDYGATDITFTQVYTESARASVRYAFINEEGEMIDFPEGVTPSEKYKVLEKKDGVHNSEKIKLFDDKPTIIKLWVVAEDGTTTDAKNGQEIFRFNPILLRWSYTAKDASTAKFKDFENEAYGSIEFEKSKITDPAGKVYIAVKVWDDETGGFKIKDTDGQGNFEKINKVAEDRMMQPYMLKFDASKLKDGSETELTFKCNLWKSDMSVDCFTYVVKLTAKD